MHVVVIVYQDASFRGVRCWEEGGGGSSQSGEELPHDKRSPLN